MEEFSLASTTNHPMRNLWRTTASLLRQHPILWLPVVLAEFVNFNLRWFERLLQHHLIQLLILWFSQTHSVLSSTPVHVQPTESIMLKVVLLTAPLEWSMRFLCAAVSVSSLVATAAILQNIAETGCGTIRVVPVSIRLSIRRILIFALQLLAFIVASGFLVALLTPLIAALNLPDKLAQLFSLSIEAKIALDSSQFIHYLTRNIVVVPVALLLLYIMAPAAVRLLQLPYSVPAEHQAKRARIAALFAAVAIFVLGYLNSMLEAPFIQQLNLQSSLAIYCYRIIVALILTLPYVPLFIAFYLIANPESPLVAAPDSLVAPPEEDAEPPLEVSL